MICTIHPTCPIGATHAAHPNCSIYPAHCSPYLHCLPTHLIDTTPFGLPHLHLLLHFCLTHLVCATNSSQSMPPLIPSHLRSSESAVSKEHRVSGAGLLFRRGE